ncbi:hypothetical protein J6Q66_08770 [bacterium]|nr:hypothetical protein [bacterium]
MSMKIGTDMVAYAQKMLNKTPNPSGARNALNSQKALERTLTASTATIIDSFGTNKVLKLQGLYAKHAALPVDSPARKAVEKEIQKILKTLNKS